MAYRSPYYCDQLGIPPETAAQLYPLRSHQENRCISLSGRAASAGIQPIDGSHRSGNNTTEFGMLMPMLRQLSLQKRWIVWIAPPVIPDPVILWHWGIDPSKVLVIHAKQVADRLQALAQGLAYGNCAAVLCWKKRVPGDFTQLALQLAAARGNSLGVLLGECLGQEQLADPGSWPVIWTSMSGNCTGPDTRARGWPGATGPAPDPHRPLYPAGH